MQDTLSNPIVAKPLPFPVGNSDWVHIAEFNWHAGKRVVLAK